MYALLISTGVLTSISNAKVVEAIIIFFQLFGMMNFFLFLFNLIPLPPLDGYRIVEDLVPHRFRAKLQQFEQWSVFIFLLILFIPVLREHTIKPIYMMAYGLYYHFMNVFLHLM